MKAGAGLWIGVAVGFTLLAVAWLVLFWVAGRADVHSVPLVKAPAPAAEAR